MGFSCLVDKENPHSASPVEWWASQIARLASSCRPQRIVPVSRVEALTPLPKHPVSAVSRLTPRRGSSLAGGTAAYSSSPPKLIDHRGSVAEHTMSR